MLGKYGSMARDFLRENYPERYTDLSAQEIQEIFSKVNDEAKERLEILIEQLMEKDPIKNQNNFMETYQHRLKIKAIAEEFIFNEIIYIKR